MKKIFFVSLLVTVQACTAVLCHAQSPAPAAQASASDEAKLKELLQSPQGVYPDFQNGVLKRAYIVILIPLPKSMQPASAKKYAFTRASVQVAGEFVKWLRQNVRATTVDNQQQLVQSQGASNANGTTNSEQTSDATNTSAMNSSDAEGVAKGIVSRTYQIKDGELVAIYGWSPKLSQAADQAEDMSKGGTSGVAAPQSEVSQDAPRPVQGNPVQPLQEKKASATNLSDF